ncbi:MAG: YceI family protein [Bacteroidetes bacterium]|nr:YceI family protein [Bacteroidota bacterium]
MRLIVRIILIIVLGILFNLNGLAAKPYNFSYCFLDHIQIEGETNLNQFNLIYNSTNENRFTHNRLELDDPNEIIEFKIPVYQFEGQNPLMEHDFREMLDADNHPVIIVGIKENCMEKIFSETRDDKIEFLLTIAGETKHITGFYDPIFGSNEILIKGFTEIKLSDFSIKPPEKMFGMLQVKDAIIIKFDIIISRNPT